MYNKWPHHIKVFLHLKQEAETMCIYINNERSLDHPENSKSNLIIGLQQILTDELGEALNV